MARRPPKEAKTSGAETPATEQSILGRWSRRKHEARERTRLAKVAPALDEPVPTQSKQSAIEKTDADMPPLESLGEQSDYSGFMSSGVSEQLRRAALRKLFHLPKFNVVDGLDDYADDYTFFSPLGEVVTAHQRHQQGSEQDKARDRRAKEIQPSDKPDDGAPAVANEEAREISAQAPPQPDAEADEARADTKQGQRDEPGKPRG